MVSCKSAQKIRQHISLETFKTYEDALTKALQVEMDEDFPAYLVDTRMEEQLVLKQIFLTMYHVRQTEVVC